MHDRKHGRMMHFSVWRQDKFRASSISDSQMRSGLPCGAASVHSGTIGRAWPKNNGIRIDHLLLLYTSTLTSLEIQASPGRGAREKPPDLAPIWAELDI